MGSRAYHMKIPERAKLASGLVFILSIRYLTTSVYVNTLNTSADRAYQPPTWNLTINDTNPAFLYCAAPGSCINYQMIGVINPVGSSIISLKLSN